MNTTTHITEGTKAFTSHGVGTYKRTLGRHTAPDGQMWLLIRRDDGGVQVELWTTSGEYVRDATYDFED